MVVMGLGYYSTIRNLRSQVQETSQARCTGGRPLIILTEDYENLPTINLIVQNVGSGPANITFEFPSPVESSDGFVLSDLAFFDEGITSLAPGDSIVCYWDELANLQPMYQEGGRLDRASRSRLVIRTLPGAPTRTIGRLTPCSTRGLRTIGYRGVSELVDVVEKISEKGIGNDKE
jgi:hypothetical protein